MYENADIADVVWCLMQQDGDRRDNPEVRFGRIGRCNGDAVDKTVNRSPSRILAARDFFCFPKDPTGAVSGCKA